MRIFQIFYIYSNNNITYTRPYSEAVMPENLRQDLILRHITVKYCQYEAAMQIEYKILYNI